MGEFDNFKKMGSNSPPKSNYVVSKILSHKFVMQGPSDLGEGRG